VLLPGDDPRLINQPARQVHRLWSLRGKADDMIAADNRPAPVMPARPRDEHRRQEEPSAGPCDSPVKTDGPPGQAHRSRNEPPFLVGLEKLIGENADREG